MNRVLHGHCIDLLRTLPDQSAHCCVTSPPYWALRDYKTPPVSWDPVTFTPVAGLPEMTVPAWEGHLGLEPDPWHFVGHIVAVFREVRRVLRDDGTLWLNFGDSYNAMQGTQRLDESAHNTRGGAQKAKSVSYDIKRPQPAGLKPKDLCGIPWRVAFALQADGWWLRMDNIWHKPNPMPESTTDRPTKAHEYVFLLAKSARYFYDAEAIKEPASGTANPRGNGVNPKAKLPGFDSRVHLTHAVNGSAPQARQNSSFSAAVAGLVETRNKRSVWTVASMPYKEAHFATYPPDLIKPCLLAGTSAQGCCSQCGAPWERMVEAALTFQSGSGKSGQPISGKNGKHLQGGGDTGDIRKGPVKSTTTTGWKPTCACTGPEGPPPVVPCTVLDPFLGSGTTAEVAHELGRHCVGIELGAHHLPLIHRRTDITPGLPNLA